MGSSCIVKELEISPAYLSYTVNGKRPWRKDLFQCYMGAVNSEVVGEETQLEDQAPPDGTEEGPVVIRG